MRSNAQVDDAATMAGSACKGGAGTCGEVVVLVCNTVRAVQHHQRACGAKNKAVTHAHCNSLLRKSICQLLIEEGERPRGL